MTVALTLKSSAYGSPVTSLTTTSVSLPCGYVSFLCVHSRCTTTGTPVTPTATGWTQVVTYNYDTSSPGKRLTVFSRVPSVSETGTHTVDFGGETQTGTRVYILTGTGLKTTGTNGADAVRQTATNATLTAGGVSVTATLGTTVAGNASLALFGATFGAAAINTGSSMTALDTNLDATLNSMVEWKNTNDTTLTASVTTNAEIIGIIGLELAAGNDPFGVPWTAGS